MSRRPEGPLRRGWTTGACAAAAARAAFEALHTGHFPDPVTVALPRGERPAFALATHRAGDGWAEATVIKDAGDDPDVTHGAPITANVAGNPAGGILYRAGEGVGTVTRPGLQLAVGEPAINPKPREIIARALSEAATALGRTADATVTISIPGGAELAKKTLNARLGILGGLSILGTTGIVIPYSCSSWIHSIHRGIDVARAAGLTHLAGSTGRVSEEAVQRLHRLPEEALIEMGDFAGGLLKYLRDHPVPRLTISGGFAKLAKLADGYLDLHSGASQVDIDGLARALGGLGASPALVAAARAAASGGAVMALAEEAGLPLADLIARRSREVALATLAGGIAVDVAVFDRSGRLLAHAGP
ncbi:MAG: cobalt-precorrin-5B (C(1))-methyltransferase [Alphaproteobacteria bacterium]|nr:cobalt-precorrin-5B (C(1))-methyltransferase [Alphaproteobacteria bacterium]